MDPVRERQSAPSRGWNKGGHETPAIESKVNESGKRMHRSSEQDLCVCVCLCACLNGNAVAAINWNVAVGCGRRPGQCRDFSSSVTKANKSTTVTKQQWLRRDDKLSF